MKKSFATILAVFSLIINFLCFWYLDTLFNRLFIFGLIPFGISILILIVSIVFSIVFVVRSEKKLTAYIPLVISIITVILILVFPFRMAKVNLELELFEGDRLRVIEMVKDGEISTDNVGNAKLPTKYGHLSSDGEIHIYQNDDEQVISFWVFRGMLSGSVELIYSSENEALVLKNESAHSITNITELKEHWYLVYTDY